MEDIKKYHGYLALPRHTKLLERDLGHSLFGFYMTLIMDARWYRGNPQMGCVVGTQIEIASRLNVNQSTISRGVDALYEKKGRYVLKHKKYVLLGFFPLFLIDVARKMDKKTYADVHELYADMYQINAGLQEKYAASQENHVQNSTQRLNSSSKDNSYSFSRDISKEDSSEIPEEQIGKVGEE